MFLLIPYEVRTLIQRNPWTNLALIAANIGIFLAANYGGLSDETVEAMVLTDWSPIGLLGHQFLHAGWMHLLGNMLFLFVFGNAVCGVMNGFLYFGAYVVFGVLAATTHLLIDGTPAVGASGALCGVMGLYMAIYPLNHIHCFWLFLIRGGTFDVAGWILILFWFAADLLGAFTGGGDIAHWAHVGGTVSGFVVGLVLLQFRLIDIFDYDNPTALDWISRSESA